MKTIRLKSSMVWIVACSLGLAICSWPQGAAGSEAATNNKAYPILYRLHRGHVMASFTLAGDAQIHLGNNTNAGLTDLRVGQVAHVSYTIENGLWLAHNISVNAKGSGQSHSAGTNYLHAHGQILGYNAATGNLTISYHR